MSIGDLDKAYVSPYDKFFYGWDEKHKPTASQIKEIKKHQAIAQARDVKLEKKETLVIWEAF
jgi:hypothetical protein